LREKNWRKPLIDKLDPGSAKPSVGTPNQVSASDVYRDANSALGQLFAAFLNFFGESGKAKKVQAQSGSGRRRRGSSRPQKKRGWW